MTYFSLYVILNEVKNPTEELTTHMFFTLVVGYFAALNMTYFSLHVILNEVKNPTEELTTHMLFTLVVGYFAALNMTCFFYLSLQGGVATAAIPSKKYAISISKEKANFISTDICGSVYPKTFRGYCTTNEFILQAF